MNPSSPLDAIRKQIAQGHLEAALQSLQQLLAQSPQLDEAIQQSGRFQALRKSIRQGTLSHEEATLTRNQIQAALLDLLLEIDTQAQAPAIQQELAQVQILNSKNVLHNSSIQAGGNIRIGDETTVNQGLGQKFWLILLVSLLAIAAAWYAYRSQQLKQPRQLKVHLQNQTPNAELPEPQGTISLTAIAGEYHQRLEQEKSTVRFELIPAAQLGKLLRLQYQAPGFVPVDTQILFQAGQLTLPIRRNQDLALIQGTVKDEAGNYIVGVRVSIAACCETYSDSLGEFRLAIPFAHQRLKQTLKLYKKGYRPEDAWSTPVFSGESVSCTLNPQP